MVAPDKHHPTGLNPPSSFYRIVNNKISSALGALCTLGGGIDIKNPP